MFKSKFKDDASLPISSVSIIGAGNTFTGDLDCSGDLRIDGTVKGDIYSKAKVIIGLGGFIEGDIRCNEADVSGRVHGNIFTKASLILKQNATVHGDVHTTKFIIEPTATFNGKSFMGENNANNIADIDKTDLLEQSEKSLLLVAQAV
jgi:cytoskeletal protein CcmA (bactofilin family)